MPGTKQSGGRNRLPTALHILRGQPKKGRINTREPQYAVLLNIEPPAFLDAEAAAEWRRLSPALCAQKILTEADCAPFAAYCAAFSDFKRASEQLAQHGDIVANGESVCLSPFLKMKRDAEAAMVRWGREFGFTPQSRAGIVTPQADEGTGELARWKAKYALAQMDRKKSYGK